MNPGSITTMWLIAGTICFFLEAMAIPGVGFLFAGFAALTVGGLLAGGLLDAANVLTQLGVFFIATAVWAAALWKPLKRLQSKNEYQNIVGGTAIVDSEPLEKGKTGQVKWSGTVMRARLAEDATDSIPAGNEVKILSVKGNVLTVTSV